MYAVLDVETTGLRTSRHDRVVEVAVVHVNSQGHVEHQWCSLVNPDRDLGPQSIHGITAAEARRAPTFTHLAGTITSLLRGRVLVAHNVAFDAAFLRAEFDRLGYQVPVDAQHGLCTMRLAGQFLPTAGRGLHDCRRHAGLPAHHPHSALHDAYAAAELLIYYLTWAGSPPPWAPAITYAATQPWPDIPAPTAAPVHRLSAGHREPHFLARLVDRLPRLDEPHADAYLDVLDRALLDRHICDTEADVLVATAHDLGLARADVVFLHQQYLTGLAAAALDDGILTTDERQDLHAVAALLGLDVKDADRALTAAENRPVYRRRPWLLSPGDIVVFTGAMDPPRDHWETEAIAAGLRVGHTITKKTHLLIAADPDSLSGKAKKARQYNVPIVHPTAYKNMLQSLPRRSPTSAPTQLVHG